MRILLSNKGILIIPPSRIRTKNRKPKRAGQSAGQSAGLADLAGLAGQSAGLAELAGLACQSAGQRVKYECWSKVE